MEEKLNELKEQGVTVYSHSRLGTFNNCEYEYYHTYCKKDRGIDNVYTKMGSCIHDNIEKLYKNETNIETFRNEYDNAFIELELSGMNFPSEKIGDAWRKDVDHFMANFSKLDYKMLLEKLIVFEIDDGVWMQGYIDAIKPSEQGKPYIDIIDWKTSSKFSGKKLTEAGRQLLMYKVGLEQTSNFKVDKVMWFMVKYIYVCTKQKNGKIKKKMCNRGKWVKEILPQLEKELIKCGLDEFEYELLLDNAVESNSLDGLPESVQNAFWLEDCFVEYEVDEDKINEFKSYVVDTVKAIESKDPNNKDEWKPIEITKYNAFYCSVLCGHRKHCEFYKQFLEENADSFEKKDKNDELTDLFG